MKMIDVWHFNFRAGVVYTVAETFTDFYGDVFSRGETLTFVEKHFLPYHGGHTIVFKERNLYLQEEANENILRFLDKYLLTNAFGER